MIFKLFYPWYPGLTSTMSTEVITCGEFSDQAVHVGYFSIQSKHIVDEGCRGETGGCTAGLFVSMRLTELRTNVQPLSKRLNLGRQKQYPD